VIPGFNLDIKHKGKTFHIQTEDSGPANPVIMTHLFIFGTILGSRRLEYADAVGRPDLAEHVRELMRAELKAMHRSLLAGDFDELARRPQKKGVSEIPLARRTGNQGPVIPGPTPAVTGGPPPVAPTFGDERTDLLTRPAPGTELPDPMATLDIDDVLDASDIVESINESPDAPDAGDAAEDAGTAELESVELVSVIEEPTAVRPTTAPIDRTTFPAMLPRAATPVRAPRANVEFPTELVAETRFDDVILAWLLEDVDEP
jgi:hypothetical protein